MNKPEKPNIIIPESFAENGVKTDFDSNKLLNGFDRIQPDVLAGDNLNKFIDDTYKGLNYALSLGDYIENKVSKSGDTMTGTLDIKTNGIGLAYYDQNVDLTTLPSTNQYSGILIGDKNEIRIGQLECSFLSDGARTTTINTMFTAADGTKSYCAIGTGFKADGTPYTRAQTPNSSDNSTQIATTAFVKSVLSSNGNGLATFQKGANGYIKFSNGVIVQWGRFSLGGGVYDKAGTITMPTSFTGADTYSVAGTGMKGAETANLGTTFSIANMTATSFYFRLLYTVSNKNGASWVTWIAMGY